VRRWQKLEATEEASKLLVERGYVAAANGDEAGLLWSPTYSRVSGEMPLDELVPIALGEGQPPISMLRFELELTTAGAIRLLFNSPSGVTLWLDGEQRPVADDMTLELPTGRHRVTLAVDRTARNDALRVELVDVDGSPAQAQLVGGK